MLDRDVVLAKLATIERCLARIDAARSAPGRLEPDFVDDVTDLNLLRAVQAALGLALHVASGEGYGLPDSAADVFTRLEQTGVLPRALAERLRKLVGFRNVAIHDYAKLDRAIVEAIVQSRLDDLRNFGRLVVETFGVE